MNNKGLGKGLDALFPEETTEEQTMKQLPVDKIQPDPNQPRNRFDPDQLQELTRSIESQGLIEPVIVRPADDPEKPYMLVAGERRWRASCQAELDVIPALIRSMSQTDALSISLVENIQRENLTAVEEARAYQQLMNKQSWNQSELAEHVGKSRSAIANRIRLLNLPETVLETLNNQAISPGHARALLGLKDAPEKKLNTILKNIIENGWSVRKTEKKIKQWNNQKKSNESHATTPPTEPGTRDFGPLEAELEDSIGAEVQIETKDNRQGHIKIYFGDPDEFDALQKRLQLLDQQDQET